MSSNHQLGMEYPVVDFDPTQPLPVSQVQENWQEFKQDGLETIAWEDNLSRFGAAGVFLKECAPVGIIITSFLINMCVISLNVTFPNAGPEKYFTNPAMLIMGSFFVFFTIALHRRTRLAIDLKNAADFAVFESVRRYLRGRYGFTPARWEMALADILVSGHSDTARFTSEYRLVSRMRGGEQVFMICNINGEAPLTNDHH